MYQIERSEPAGTITLTATGASPAELVQAALRGVLDVALGRTGPAADAEGAEETSVSLPVQGVGVDLGELYVALSADLLDQLEEYGSGFDDVRLDGLLRTDSGGYSAWGYLGGEPSRDGQSPRSLTVVTPTIVEADGGWRLVGELRPG